MDREEPRVKTSAGLRCMENGPGGTIYTGVAQKKGVRNEKEAEVGHVMGIKNPVGKKASYTARGGGRENKKQHLARRLAKRGKLR